MWKEYSSGYLKNNRASGLSVVISAFISALLLSLLSGLLYNMWKYEVERIKLEEGGWHSRIVGEFEEEEIEAVRNFATVEEAVINEEEAEGREAALDLYFYNMRNALEDTPRIAQIAGASPDAVSYNYELLAMYLIRDPQDTAPRLVFPTFLLITAIAILSLIMIIRNAFAVSMNARVYQFGIFSSIGATPGQIRSCLLQEAAALCAIPVILGNVLGIAGCMGTVWMIEALLGSGVPGRHKMTFGYHPLILLLTLLLTIVTIWISAWMPARKLSRRTPLEAIRDTGELQPGRRKRSPLLALLFGIEGELAGNALKAQRKAMRTATLSLIFSFLAFTLMQCFFTLSGISTRETYFEKYQDVWDIMLTVKDTDVDSFAEAGAIRELPGVRSSIAYQKASAKRVVTEEEMSSEMKSFGGFSHASDKEVVKTDEGYLVNAPIVILDDESFLVYCEQAGAEPRLDGAIIWNRIRDVTNPDFRHPEYMPYVKGEKDTTVLRQAGQEEIAAEIPVLAYTEEVPALREDYATLDYYELVHFIPVSLWSGIKEEIGGTEEDTYVCILGREDVTLEELNTLQEEIERTAGSPDLLESENRIQEKEINDKQIQGMMIILGGFCVLFAVIGIGNLFSHTLGFVRQRKREFGRYLSVGVTPGELRKMFCIEALVVAGRPVLVTAPLTAIAVWYMLKMSYLEAEIFLAEAPIFPVAVFMAAIVGAAALAYYLGWRNIRRISLVEILRDDTLL